MIRKIPRIKLTFTLTNFNDFDTLLILERDDFFVLQNDEKLITYQIYICFTLGSCPKLQILHKAKIMSRARE